MYFTRAGGDDPGRVPLHALTGKQRRLLEVIARYCDATGEACPGNYLARREGVHHSTVREHLEALYRRGWLNSPNAPVTLRYRLDE
jgi:DNA-binding MarR family transcriptional regulator